MVQPFGETSEDVSLKYPGRSGFETCTPGPLGPGPSGGSGGAWRPRTSLLVRRNLRELRLGEVRKNAIISAQRTRPTNGRTTSRGSHGQVKPEQRMMWPRRYRIVEQRRPILHPEILALQRPAAGGAVLYLLGISLARLYIVEEDPSVMPFDLPELCPQFVCPSARAIQRGHRLTSLIGTS